ncbi:zinc-binding dehydrogenase [Pseudomonas sp. N040]|uniref:zinc-binding dehydrogenase n=1 Tax=Pseudomonas sp. N040 TaxID=2785325 RepID=UPI0018A264F4|nr:zinc-binding dehydrogenase [Pseudomonas sp. N040]MBF7729770.1 zinc-binding dehydrogenase [Pseudomonas sp. N040]MBW7013412.1 zinc-binding dehydrogenase [Pseudomonas sp. N040]
MSATGLQLRSLVKSSAELELSLVRLPVPVPAADEVIIRVEATPLNPSDLGLLFAAADLSTVKAAGTADAPLVTASIAERAMPAMRGRLDQSLPVGNEGAGTVIAAGASAQAQALLGKTVALSGGGMYVQYRCAKAEQCIVLPEGCSAAEGASIFVNPMTAVSMLDVMRREGHRALVHTAAASNLGQMLNRLCLQERVDLVNIVRSPQQVELLRSMGAQHVCDTSAPTFVEDLTQALIATGATLAFDAIGGGSLASQILSCMEAAISRSATQYNRYGSATHKQVYIYGGLDQGPTVLKRNFGPAFGVGGWLLPNYLQKVGAEARRQFQNQVLAGLKTTFACHYAREISLAEALHPDAIAAYSRPSTGGKYLINPARELAPPAD